MSLAIDTCLGRVTFISTIIYMCKNKFIFQWWSKVVFTNTAYCYGCSWAVNWMCMSVHVHRHTHQHTHTHTHTHTQNPGIGICAFMVRKCIASVRVPKGCHPYKVKKCYSSLFISHLLKYMKIQVNNSWRNEWDTFEQILNVSLICRFNYF